jgi:hypothetical protein
MNKGVPLSNYRPGERSATGSQKKAMGTVYRKVSVAAKAHRLALKSSTLNPILQRYVPRRMCASFTLFKQDSAYD